MTYGWWTSWRSRFRFIPQRSNNDLHAAYTLLPDGPEATSGFVPSGIYGEGLAASINARRAEVDRSRKRSMMAEGDGIRGMSYRPTGTRAVTIFNRPGVLFCGDHR